MAEMLRNQKPKTINSSIVHSFQLQVRNRRYDQREFFNSNIGRIQPEASFFRKAMFFQPEMSFMITLSQKGNSISWAQVFFHYHKLKITNGITARQTFVTADDVHFFVRHQIFHHFSKH